MVRVAGLREQAFGDVPPQDAAGRRPRRRSRSCNGSRARTGSWSPSSTAAGTKAILPALAEQRIRISPVERVRQAAAAQVVDEFFRQAAFPILTPMAIDPSHPSPRFHNRGLYLAAHVAAHQRLGPAGAVRRRAIAAGVAAVRRRRRPDEKQKFILLEDIDRLQAAGTVRRLRDRRTTRRSASRATWTSTCSSKSRTTCCARSNRVFGAATLRSGAAGSVSRT